MAEKPDAPKPIDAFLKGQRVQLRPETRADIRDRWGEVIVVGKEFVHVLMESGDLRAFRPDEIVVAPK
jgi:hypothetical protein